MENYADSSEMLRLYMAQGLLRFYSDEQ